MTKNESTNNNCNNDDNVSFLMTKTIDNSDKGRISNNNNSNSNNDDL